MEDVKALLNPADLEELFGRPILSSTRVSLRSVMRFLNAADRHLGNGDLSLLHRCMQHKARVEVHGIYRAFFLILSPARVFTRVSAMWKQLYSEGDAQTIIEGDKRVVVRVENVPDMPLNHDITVAAYSEEVLRIIGCKNPRSEIRVRPSKDKGICEIAFSWD